MALYIDKDIYVGDTGVQLSALGEIANKAPKSHASSGTTYGVGTTSNYGHCKVINNLTTSSATNGYALQAYQGKVLKDLLGNVGHYGVLYQFASNQTVTASSWTKTTYPLNNGNPRFYNDGSSDFEQSGHGIKCNFSGMVLVIRVINTNSTSQLDIYDHYDRSLNVGTYSHVNVSLQPVSSGNVLYLQFQGSSTSFTGYLGSSLQILRLS